MFFGKIKDIIICYEVKFIKLCQKVLGSPADNIYLIKLGKLITKDESHQRILMYSVLFNIMQVLFENNHISYGIYAILYSLINYFKLFCLMKVSRYINYIIKSLFQIKRPYVIHDNIKNITIKKDKSKSFSFPSNSVQNSYVFYWSILNFLFPKYYYYNNILVYIIVLFIGLIKTIRGLHYLHDIISGIFIARLIIYLYNNYFLIF